MKPSRLPVLLFDVLGTLVHDPFYDELPAFFGISFEELLAQKHPRAWIEFETSLIDEPTAVSRMFRDGRVVNAERLKAHMRASYRWLEGMEELLTELRAGSWSLHLMSNYPCWYRIIEEQLGLARYAPWSFVSCETGVRKPARAAFERAMDGLGVEASALLLIDDQPGNCEGARQVGLDAIRFTDVTALRLALAARGIE